MGKKSGRPCPSDPPLALNLAFWTSFKCASILAAVSLDGERVCTTRPTTKGFDGDMGVTGICWTRSLAVVLVGECGGSHLGVVKISGDLEVGYDLPKSNAEAIGTIPLVPSSSEGRR